LARTQQIHRLLTKDQIERHFGRINQPTAQELFKGYKKNYPPRRASSSQWSSPMSDRKYLFKTRGSLCGQFFGETGGCFL